MIGNDAQLAQALEQMGRMYKALSTVHTEILPQNRQQFALMAEGPLDELRRLQNEVSEYVGLSEQNSESFSSDSATDEAAA